MQFQVTSEECFCFLRMLREPLTNLKERKKVLLLDILQKTCPIHFGGRTNDDHWREVKERTTGTRWGTRKSTVRTPFSTLLRASYSDVTSFKPLLRAININTQEAISLFLSFPPITDNTLSENSFLFFLLLQRVDDDDRLNIDFHKRILI